MFGVWLFVVCGLVSRFQNNQQKFVGRYSQSCCIASFKPNVTCQSKTLTESLDLTLWSVNCPTITAGWLLSDWYVISCILISLIWMLMNRSFFFYEQLHTYIYMRLPNLFLLNVYKKVFYIVIYHTVSHKLNTVVRLNVKYVLAKYKIVYRYSVLAVKWTMS